MKTRVSSNQVISIKPSNQSLSSADQIKTIRTINSLSTYSDPNLIISNVISIVSYSNSSTRSPLGKC